MDINIILRINLSLKGNIGSITKELGNYRFTIDDENTPFLHLKKIYLETSKPSPLMTLSTKPLPHIYHTVPTLNSFDDLWQSMVHLRS